VDPLTPGRQLTIGFYRITGERRADPHTPSRSVPDPRR
jgi:hypothetical protein